MNSINLLPWREIKRRERRRQFHALLMLSCLSGLAILLFVSAVDATRLARQQVRNAWLSSEIKQLDAQLSEIKEMGEQIAWLQAKRLAVTQLQQRRWQAVQLVDALTQSVPEGIVLRSLKQSDTVLLNGYAQSNARVSEFLHQLDAGVSQLGTAELVEIKASSLGQGRELRKAFEFSITLHSPVAVTASAAPNLPAKP